MTTDPTVTKTAVTTPAPGNTPDSSPPAPETSDDPNRGNINRPGELYGSEFQQQRAAARGKVTT